MRLQPTEDEADGATCTFLLLLHARDFAVAAKLAVARAALIHAAGRERERKKEDACERGEVRREGEGGVACVSARARSALV